MSLRMDGAGNSSTCLGAQTCLPLGGHSVLATLPPLPPSAPRAGAGAVAAAAAAGGGDLPAIWVLAQVDTASLFHEAMSGADAPVSGLIAMLAAAEVLGSPNATAALAAAGARYRRRLVFAALGGEPWALMGSKRLLWELSGGGGGGNGTALLPGLGVGNGSVAGVSCWAPAGGGQLAAGAVRPCRTVQHASQRGSARIQAACPGRPPYPHNRCSK